MFWGDQNINRSSTDDRRKRRKMSKMFWASLEVDLRARMRMKKGAPHGKSVGGPEFVLLRG